MAHNPIMEKNPYFSTNAQTPNGYPSMPGYTPQTSTNTPTNAPHISTQLKTPTYNTNHTYPQPAYTPQPRVMTYKMAMEKTGILLAVAIIAGLITAFVIPLQYTLGASVLISIATLIVGFIGAFQKMVHPAIAITYAALEGALLGALTMAMNMMYPGIFAEALIATAVVVAVSVMLHTSGKVRTTAKGWRIVMTIAIAAIIYAVADMLLVRFGIIETSFDNTSIAGMPLGLILGIILIIVGAYFLIGDLELIKNASANGAPERFAWTCAYGLTLSIIWIYVEVLRTLYYLHSSFND
ncbi:MAG: Bax inhibitor-1/YccA family protein [Actinomycetaceae bacterium]|nr:Bax inhibitor-1/YccA family protein [Actinomycetaceae bacterium]